MKTYKSVNYGLEYPHLDMENRRRIISYINFKLATHGLPSAPLEDEQLNTLTRGMVRNFRQKNRLLEGYLPPVDQRIQGYLDTVIGTVKGMKKAPLLPSNTFVLDQYGLAREMSLPPDKHEFHTDIVHSYRIKQGVLHNPKHDRRTTKGVFHVAEGGLPVPPDKKAVPLITFAKLYQAALNPPAELAALPFTASAETSAQCFVSLLLKPTVQPEVKGVLNERYMEVRFFVPGNLVSNLDFVESIFGNAGDPYLPQNDSALDPAHWTGHTGCVILATHLTTLKKKDLYLPHEKKATERQKQDGMCWKDPDELYNDGTPFKITCRNEQGVMVTLIADNYFGYSKKEVKTQISYSSNLFGMTEEEHAGGALAFPSYSLGMKFVPDTNLKPQGHTFKKIKDYLGDWIDFQPAGYGIDRNFSEVIYLPEDAVIDLENQKAFWQDESAGRQELRVLPDNVYIHPTGYKVQMEQHPGSKAWRLVGTTAEGTLCHKPCTVSGGGKSEISKSLWDAVYFMPFFIADYKHDMDWVESIVNKNYSDRFIKHPLGPDYKSRPVLSQDRSLGSVIKLLTPSDNYTKDFNRWLQTIPHRIKALVFLVKRFYQEEWGAKWRDKFSVDVVNATSGNILKFNDRALLGTYLRVGVLEDGSGWTHKLRQDFMPAKKVQWEDDISASVVFPKEWAEGLNPKYTNRSIKFTGNCESRFFQRPDEAVHRGYDKQAEYDLSTPSAFLSNFEPFPREKAREFKERSLEFTQYTSPVKELICAVLNDPACRFFALSSHPRIVDGAPSKNPRYLQTDPTLLKPLDRYLADVGVRLYRKIAAGKPVHHPINAVLPGRRNNPPNNKIGIRSLAVYAPIHYQELPELFMDFIASLTGKSPSTTGAGSEGALTKGPFNALSAITDLNNALLSFILTGYNSFTSAAGYVGPKFRVDHDISLLIPEVWTRLSPQEREPEHLIKEGSLEKIDDFEYQGEIVPAGRLGYRITDEFAKNYLGRVFDSPSVVFSDEMLKPELQGIEDYVDGIRNIVETQQKVAQTYIDDASVNNAIPPLKALLHIMAEGSYQGKGIADPEIRKLFDREEVIKADWYYQRLKAYLAREAAYLKQEIDYLEKAITASDRQAEQDGVNLQENMKYCHSELEKISKPDFVKQLCGTLGLDTSLGK